MNTGWDILLGFYVFVVGGILYSMYESYGMESIINFFNIAGLLLIFVVACAAVGGLIRFIIDFLARWL